jgi:hypothetical protein
VVGPFTYLRPGTVLGADGKLGAFVETKNSTIGAGTKVPHLTYVGDADIGEHSNIGASSVFVNYDGTSKQRTTVGSHVRTGSDTMFVAPSPTVTGPTRERARWCARTFRPVRWRCPAASSATSRAGSRVKGPVARPQRPRRRHAQPITRHPRRRRRHHDGNGAAQQRFATYYSGASHTAAHHAQAINW